jgi:nucleotide-binding universal stress UspA family protein
MKLVIGIDGSRYSSAAVRFVAQQLVRADAQVDLIHVTAGGAGAPPKPQARPQDHARHRLAAPESWLRQAQRRLEVHGFRVGVHLRSGVPAQAIPTLAGKRGYDLVVVGAKGRSDIPFLDIGSVALATLEHAPSNVLVVRERQPKHRKKQRATRMRPLSVLFATDGSSHSLARRSAPFSIYSSLPNWKQSLSP